MDTSAMTPADFAAMSNNDFGGNNLFAMIFLFALIFGFGGFGNNGYANAIGYENLATSNELQRGFDNQNSMANQRDILAAVNQNFHDTAQYVGDRYGELQRDIAGVNMGVQQSIFNAQQCCCETKQLISDVASQQRYESAMQAAQLQQAVQAEGAATRSMIQQYRYDDLLQRYNALDQRMNTQELRGDIAAATANVVRYPNGFVYTAGPSPFCTCNGGYNI